MTNTPQQRLDRALRRLRWMTQDYAIGQIEGCSDPFSVDVRALGGTFPSISASDLYKSDFRRIFNALADLMDAVQELGPDGQGDPWAEEGP